MTIGESTVNGFSMELDAPGKLINVHPFPEFDPRDRVSATSLTRGDGVVAHQEDATEGHLWVGTVEEVDTEEGNLIMRQDPERPGVPGIPAIVAIRGMVFYRRIRVADLLPTQRTGEEPEIA